MGLRHRRIYLASRHETSPSPLQWLFMCLKAKTQHWNNRLHLKRRNMAKVKICLSCPGAQTDLYRDLKQDLVNSRGTERFHYSREVCFFYRSLALYYRKIAEKAVCGQLKLTNHLRLKSSSIKLSWITPCDSPLRIDKSTASAKKIHNFKRAVQHDVQCKMSCGMALKKQTIL